MFHFVSATHKLWHEATYLTGGKDAQIDVASSCIKNCVIDQDSHFLL